MPQQLHVVRCYNCQTFQVDIVKKIPKWSCKMCGEKQSLKKVYGTGSGKECRQFVQDLNKQNVALTVSSSSQAIDKSPEDYEDISSYVSESKWSEYISQNDDINIDNEDSITEEIFRSNTTDYYSKSNTLNSNVSNKHYINKLNMNTRDDLEDAKLELSNNFVQYNKEYEKSSKTKSNKIENSKRPFDNIENQVSKWKKFSSNEQYIRDSCVQTEELSEKLEKPKQIDSIKNSSNYENKFGVATDLDVELQF